MKGRRVPPAPAFRINKKFHLWNSSLRPDKKGLLKLGSPLAERVGFEPTIPCGILAFQASALGQLRYLSNWSEPLLYQ